MRDDRTRNGGHPDLSGWPLSSEPTKILDQLDTWPAHAGSDAGCVHHLFEAQAARTPESPAVIFEGQSLTYEALNRRANRLARRLRGLGVAPGALVGICAHRSLEIIIGLLGILKAGGAYLPLDPEYPAERLAFMLEDAQAQVLLAQEALHTRFPAFGGPILALDDRDGAAGEADTDLSGDADPDGLAYVIYTSGSTGIPKGVEIAHRGVVNNLLWRQTAFPMTPKDRLLQSYSFSFDPSVWALFWPLSCGAAVVLPQDGSTGDPAYLVETITRQGVSVLGFSPSMLNLLLEHPGFSRCRSLRHVFCGGEVLSPGLAARFFARLPGAALHNVYGPTEATIDATWWTCRPSDADAPNAAVPIGHPLPRTRVYLLDKSGQAVIDGDAGEMHIAGVGLAHGYRGRPELTQERFIASPFSHNGAEQRLYGTLYRTGDLCRRREDGAIEYLGRLDGQVKVRGFRIETGEIEAVLSGLQGVRAAAAAVRERDGDKHLVAYVVPAIPSLSRHGLREQLAAALPAHMVPGTFVFLQALPLSPSGKLDRAALPMPTAMDQERNEARVPPRTPQERQLVALFEELLGVRPLGIRDDFFEWGGHSLLAARLVAVVERLTGRRLAMTDLAKGATVEQLTARLSVLEITERDGPAPTDAEGTALPQLQRWSTGPARPFFFCHGSFTGGLWSAELARHLGPHRPLYALVPHGADGGPIPATVEAMAADYVRTIRAVQAEGPYLLGGFCNGGLVAYEMAQQLRAAGQDVALLALVEITLAPTLCKLWLHEAAGRIGRWLRLREDVRSRLSLALQARSVPILLALLTVKWSVERRLESLKSSDSFDWTPLIPKDYRKTAVYYHLRPYGGRVALVAAAESVAGVRIERRWRELTADVTFDTVPGAHFDCLHAQLLDMAGHLRTYLDVAEGAASAGRP